MKRLFARNTLIASQERGANLFAGQLAARQFASSPQKNPYSSIMTKLAAGNSQFSYYKLPALGDKRIGKSKTYIFKQRSYLCIRMRNDDLPYMV